MEAIASPEGVDSGWSPRLEVGIASIDRQHREIFELAAAFRGNGDQVRVMKSLATLCEHVKVHFREEEALMAAHAFPGLEAHRALHAEFTERLSQLLAGASAKTLDELADEISRLVGDWCNEHILTADREYLPYLKAAARQAPVAS